MNRANFGVFFLSALLSCLCREFYKADYPPSTQAWIGLISIFYFFPVVYALVTDENWVEQSLFTTKRVVLSLLLLILPYFLSVLFKLETCSMPGVNVAFVLAWGLFAYFAKISPKFRDWLILFLILSIWFAFESNWFDLWKGNLYFLNVLLAINIVILLFPLLLRYRPFLLQFKSEYLWYKPLHIFSFLFLLVAVPYGLASDFLQIKNSIDPLQIPVQFLAIFFFNGLPEEILFRGLLQVHIEKYTGFRWSLLLTSTAFGFAHLNNFPTGDYRYVILSLFAGVCFGLVFKMSQSIIPAALLHTIINTTNAVLFDKVPMI